MSANFSTIAILGGTSGIGEGLTRRFHASGKKVIATGRRLQNLQSLQSSLPGLSIQQMDVSDIANLPSQLESLFSAHPDIDTIIANAGIQQLFDYKDPSSTSVEKIQTEITTNLTFPAILAYTAIPFLLKKSKAGQQTTLIFVSSGLAFVPSPLYPLYCPTKAAIHSLSITLRAQLHDTGVKVIELAPPKVQTELDKETGEKAREIMGDKMFPAMGLEEYLDQAMVGLREGREEVAVGFAEMGLGRWREAFQPALDRMGVKG